MMTPKFSKKEKEVIKYLLEGKTNKQIAHQLGVSVRTIEFHLGNIYARLDTRSRTETVVKLTELSLRKATGKNTSKVLRDSTVAKKDTQLNNGENQTKRRFTMKNLLIGVTVGVLLTLSIVFTTSYVNRSNGVEAATPTLISFETPTPVPFEMVETATPIPVNMEETPTHLPGIIAPTLTKIP